MIMCFGPLSLKPHKRLYNTSLQSLIGSHNIVMDFGIGKVFDQLELDSFTIHSNEMVVRINDIQNTSKVTMFA